MKELGRREAFGRLFAFLTDPASAKKGGEPLRPPYGKEDALFHQRCPECDGPCVSACEEGILVRVEDGTPVLEFSKAGCTFCEKCADVCDKGVLDKAAGLLAVPGVLTLEKGSCLAWNQTICYSCKEACPDRAISLEGMFKAAVDPARCTRCGWCVGVCPTAAITVKGEPCERFC